MIFLISKQINIKKIISSLLVTQRRHFFKKRTSFFCDQFDSCQIAHDKFDSCQMAHDQFDSCQIGHRKKTSLSKWSQEKDVLFYKKVRLFFVTTKSTFFFCDHFDSCRNGHRLNWSVTARKFNVLFNVWVFAAQSTGPIA